MKYKTLALTAAIIVTFTACGNKPSDSSVPLTSNASNSAAVVSSANESASAANSTPAESVSSVTSTPATSESEIGLEAAKATALKHAGIAEADASFTETKREYDDGKIEYDIEFTANAKHYEYEIGADGTVLEFSSEAIPDPTGLISEARAKEIALAHTGFSETQVTFTKCKLDYDNGVTKYEVEFTANGVEYEVEINAKTEEILKTEIDRD